MSSYIPSWPPRPDPVYCALCRQVKQVWSYLAEKDKEIDVELVCGHRVLTTTQTRRGHGAA